MHLHDSFSMGNGHLESGPRAFGANILFTRPCPQSGFLHFCFSLAVFHVNLKGKTSVVLRILSMPASFL